MNMLLNCMKKPLLAFNINGIEEINAVCNANMQYKKPVMLLISPAAIKHAGIEYLAALIQIAKTKYEFPIFSQLDHGFEEALLVRAVNLGLDAVMIDASGMSLQDNCNYVNDMIQKLQQINEYIVVEAEVGKLAHHAIGTAEEYELTSEADLEFYATHTNANLLALSVGNIHGFDQNKPALDKNLIIRLSQITNVPFVLHGGDWVTSEDIIFATSYGFKKINVGPELRLAAGNAILKLLESGKFDIEDHRILLASVTEAMQHTAYEKFKVLYD